MHMGRTFIARSYATYLKNFQCEYVGTPLAVWTTIGALVAVIAYLALPGSPARVRFASLTIQSEPISVKLAIVQVL